MILPVFLTVIQFVNGNRLADRSSGFKRVPISHCQRIGMISQFRIGLPDFQLLGTVQILPFQSRGSLSIVDFRKRRNDGSLRGKGKLGYKSIIDAFRAQSLVSVVLSARLQISTGIVPFRSSPQTADDDDQNADDHCECRNDWNDHCDYCLLKCLLAGLLLLPSSCQYRGIRRRCGDGLGSECIGESAVVVPGLTVPP